MGMELLRRCKWNMMWEKEIGEKERERARKEIIFMMHYDVWTGFCVSYKGSSQLNLRFHRLFCIYYFPFHSFFLLAPVRLFFHVFLDNLRACEQWKEFALCHSFAWKTTKNASWTFNGFNWDKRANREQHKSWNSIRIKRIAFIVLAPEKRRRAVRLANSTEHAVAAVAVGLLFLKIHRQTWTGICIEHPNKTVKNWTDIWKNMIEVSNQNISSATT